MNRSHGPVVPLSLDPANECVHRGERALRLTPKAFAVLRHLMKRPGQLATKDELLEAVWPDTAVTEASLSTCVREIRRALDDTPATPLYIQTVYRRGYRYVGATLDATATLNASRTHPPADGLLVGRDRELASLDRFLRQVEEGERCVIFLAGEAGIGKTALVERFVARIAGRVSAHIGRGQCVEQYGACEPYLPWLDVLNQLSRDYGRDRLAAVLRRYAPMWLAQLPWLIDAGERRHLQHEIAGATRERMIRELAEALEALGADSPVLIVLEDLHWSDPSSIGLLAYLARRPRPGRLLLLGTYRPAELHVTSHPLIALKQELLLHGACEDLSLDFLTREAVAEYVRSRLPGAPDDLARQVHRHTDGNPLFMVNVIDYLLARGALVHADGGCHPSEAVQAAEAEVPESLKEMIERQLDRLSHEDRRVLEAASVTGVAFSAASVAAALEESIELVEERLGVLARRGSFVRRTERQAWPDGTQSDGYAFIHVLYQNVLYERIGTARRSRMHGRTGERLEAGYGERAQEIAAELALHFQRGRESERAVRYLAQAGENAIRRGAYVEAIALLNQGISLLSTLPEGADRDACEIQLRVPLGVCYVNTRGYAAPEVGITFQRAHELSRHATDTSRLFRVLRGLWFFAVQRADLRKARSMAEELLRVAARQRDGSGLVEGHRIMATTCFHLGNFTRALRHLQRGLALYDAERHSSHAFLYGQDPGVCCHAWHAWTQWYRGYPDQAVASAMRAIELARQIGHPFSLSYAMNFAARLHLCRGEAAAAEGHAREGLRYAQEQGLTPMVAMGQVLHGWSRTFLRDDDTAIGELREGVARWQSTGARLATPYWMYLLASALNKAGRSAEALDTLDDALAQLDRTDERWFECDLYILNGSLTAGTSRRKGSGDPRVEAQRHLRRAFHAATEMESPSLRLRAANALSVLLRDQGQTHEAKELVGTAYAAFNEGFQTADLTEARAMLAQL
jgi:DNA-binding winged helix-turn-helix (wHTH) protein/predicted ATPase